MNIAHASVLANAAEKIVPPAIFWSVDTDLKPETVALKVKTVIDPLTFIDAEGKIYRLSGLDSPALSDMDVPAEFTAQALENFKKLMIDKELLIYLTKNRDSGRLNHMGHTLIQAKIRDTDEWVQAHLLANGFARVRTTPDNTGFAEKMYKIESNARGLEFGLWAYPQYKVLSTKEITSDMTGFQIVEGEIHSASLIRNTIYLNFGPDWKTDFSIGVESAVRKALSKGNQSPQQWAKKKIRIRGPIRFYNGAFMDLTHREQIEFLDE